MEPGLPYHAVVVQLCCKGHESDMTDPANHAAAGGRHTRQSFRSRHRAQSHASAHAEADPDRPFSQVEHPLVPRGQANLVTEQQGLTHLIEHARQVGSFAYDSEFIGELTYHPKLCLIQIATTDRVTLLDPLAAIDLTPFWDLLADPSVEKIVHAGEQDIEPVARLIGRRCANIFDTQISAGFIGLAYPVSLSKLVAEITGAKLPKGLTFTHWDQRPLTPVQLRYAADDVRYLPAVRDAIGKRLEKLGHDHWAREECELLLDPARYEFDPESDFLRMRGANSLNGSGLAILRELMIWRDAAAQAADVPPRSFLRDEILIDMSRNPIKSVDRLARVKGLPRPVEAEHGQTIVQLTLRAIAQPIRGEGGGAFERAAEPTPTERFRADSVWALVQCLCHGQSIDPNLVVSRQDVGELDRLLQEGADVSSHKLLQGWRRQAVGQRVLDVVRNGGRLELEWNDALRLRDQPR
jgi:ribonuclease D